jgi:hypothetical protein
MKTNELHPISYNPKRYIDSPSCVGYRKVVTLDEFNKENQQKEESHSNLSVYTGMKVGVKL